MPLKYIEKYKSYLTPTSQNEVEQSLEKATALFYKGQYEQSLEVATKAIELIEGKV